MSYQAAIDELAYRLQMCNRLKESKLPMARDLLGQARSELLFATQVVAVLTDKEVGEIKSDVRRNYKKRL